MNINKLSHAYIAAGENADKIAMAAVCDSHNNRPCGTCIHCGKVLRGLHPDIAEITPEGREITVGQVREVRRDAYIMPNEAARKAYIISPADMMNASAQNALLKVLEDPPSHAVFILKTDNPQALLPTVRSRCAMLRSTPEMDASSDSEAEALSRSFFEALGSSDLEFVSIMFKLEKDLTKEAFAEFLTHARIHAAAALRNPELSAPEQYSRAERILARAQEYCDFNVSTGHIAGFICAELI
jgi:DNA polymerase III delta prime subunit